jgi:hypothetical protein
MNRVLQPRPLVVLGLNVWMGTAAGADELETDAVAVSGQFVLSVVYGSRHWNEGVSCWRMPEELACHVHNAGVRGCGRLHLIRGN